MTRYLALIAAAACIAAAAYPAAAARAARPSRVRVEPGHTVFDSVYTDSQVTRAESTYTQTCAKCHGAALQGAQDGGPLTGPDFLANWDGMTLADLHDKIRTTMPPDTPNTISPSQVADLVALLLARNHFPAGAAPLTADAARLKDIKIVRSRP
jgi:mono/diheme cytochrome c family protein